METYSKNGDLSVSGIFKAVSKSKSFTINQTISCVHVVPKKHRNIYLKQFTLNLKMRFTNLTVEK